VVAEEGRLTPPGVPGTEDVGAEELEKRDGRGGGRPEDEPAEDDRQVVRPPHEQRDRDREEPVLDELQIADEVVVEERVVEGHGTERLERQPREERGADDPEKARSREPGEPRPRCRSASCDQHDRDGEIREADVDRRRADADAQLGLVSLVKEEERERGREHEGPERAAVDEAAEARPRAPAVERPGRHRATIGRGLPGSIRGVASLH
jgi:hypothetical protein